MKLKPKPNHEIVHDILKLGLNRKNKIENNQLYKILGFIKHNQLDHCNVKPNKTNLLIAQMEPWFNLVQAKPFMLFLVKIVYLLKQHENTRTLFSLDLVKIMIMDPFGH